MRTLKKCPCQSGSPYESCCAPFHANEPAPSAEKLMRSRYSAYALNLYDYINATWHPDTLNTPVTADDLRGIQWLGLTVHEAKNTSNNHATVKFTVTFCQDDQTPQQMTENSRFVLSNGKWLYLDGTHA